PHHTPSHLFYSCLILRPPPTSTLFPYTTLFRSLGSSLVRNNNYAAFGQGKLALFGPARLIVGARMTYDDVSGLGTSSGQGFLLPDRKSTRLNSSHLVISYAVFCLKKKSNIWALVPAPPSPGNAEPPPATVVMIPLEETLRMRALPKFTNKRFPAPSTATPLDSPTC